MAQLIHPPPQSSGEALLLGTTCLAGCWLWRASQGCCSLSSLPHLLAPAGLLGLTQLQISASLWGQSPALLPQSPACGYWDVEMGTQQSLALNLLCRSRNRGARQPWRHTSFCRRQTDVPTPVTDIWVCHRAVGGEGCSSQLLPPVRFHWGKTACGASLFIQSSSGMWGEHPRDGS